MLEKLAAQVGPGTVPSRAGPRHCGQSAAPEIPEPLLMQLAEGGRLVIPVGSDFEQIIQRVRRTEEGLRIENLTPVRFVPLIGRYGFPEGASREQS